MHLSESSNCCEILYVRSDRLHRSRKGISMKYHILLSTVISVTTVDTLKVSDILLHTRAYVNGLKAFVFTFREELNVVSLAIRIVQ